jgi:hypothetical protein
MSQPESLPDHSSTALSHWQRVGPPLRYTNERAREMERSVGGFAKLVNDDLYDLLKWAAALNGEIDELRRLLANATDPENRGDWEEAREQGWAYVRDALDEERGDATS